MTLLTSARSPNPGARRSTRPRGQALVRLVARLIIGVPGAYALSAAWTFFLARTLPQSRIEATLTASMLSFAIMMGWTVFTFASPTIRRAAILLILALAAPVLGIWLGGQL